jgi:hypothetical protein
MMTLTHATASATQYGKRYSLGMAFNISIDKDDDGNAASPQHRPMPAAESKPLRPHVVDKNGDTVDYEPATGEVIENDKVTPAQRDQLVRMADDLGVDKAAFCKYFDIPSLADVPAAAFEKAKTAMLAAKKKRG